MNEETTKLLTQLANKLGTTIEHLWGVLIRQAPISATTTLIQIVLLLLPSLLTWKAHKWLTKNNKYEDSEGWGVAMLIAMIISTIMFGVCVSSLDEVISGYFNPEYWALKQIIK